MRLLVLALALSFTLAPMQAKQTSIRTAKVTTVKAKTRRNSKAPKARKAKRPAKRVRNRAN